jgi:broad specificity phosphatase PhoE
VLYGHLPGFRLSASGRAQAEELGRRLRDSGLARIVHSPLERARETAELICAQLPAPVPLIAEPELREAEFGRYLQGVPFWQVPLRRPLWFVHRARRGLLPGDESVEQMGGRILRVAYALSADHPGELSALISHQDPIQAAWILLDHRPQQEPEMHRKAMHRAGMLDIELEGTRLVRLTYVRPPEVARPRSLD